MNTTDSLECFLRPTAVAVMGASDDPTRIGGRPLRYLIEAGFSGAIAPINPNRSYVQGLKAYKSILDVPYPVDCALVVVPTQQATDAVMQAIAAGVKGILILTAGYAETGPQGLRQQQKMVEAARAAGVRILGPNCLGVFDTRHRTYLTFSGVFEDVVGTEGKLGLISQSGGFAGEIVKLAAQRRVHFASWITTGNEADVDLGEALEYFAADPGIRVIGAFLEGVRESHAFLKGLEQARRERKPVILLKAGRSEAGAAAIKSHTANLAGQDRVYDAVFSRYGAYRANTIDEMLDVMYAAQSGILPRGNRLAIVTTSGGNGALAADYAIEEGFQLVPPMVQVQEGIYRLCENAAAANPVDLTAKVGHEPAILGNTIDLLLDSGQYDCLYVFVGLAAGMTALKEPIWEVLRDLPARYPDIPITLSLTASADLLERYEKAGYLLVPDASRAMTVLGALRSFATGFERPVTPPMDVPASSLPRIPAGQVFTEPEAKALLNGIGIPSLPEIFVKNAREAQSAVPTATTSWAIKVVSPDIVHKSDVGGVQLDVATASVGSAVAAMAQKVRQHMPAARIDGYLLSPMMVSKLEFFMGIQFDEVFGPMVMVGAGGVMIELLHDVACRMAPITSGDAIEMLQSLKTFPVLKGYRASPPADIEAFATAISALSELAWVNASTLKSLEVNPMVINTAGAGIVALDAVIETLPRELVSAESIVLPKDHR